MADTQSYATHRQYVPLFHFFVLPIIGLNLLVQIYFLIRHPAIWGFWNVLVAAALAALVWTTRGMATRAQDRIIRLEETLRLQQLLPSDLLPRVGELTTDQLIGLRFCADDELPDLCRAVFSGEVGGREAIKRRVKNWRPDTLRV